MCKYVLIILLSFLQKQIKRYLEISATIILSLLQVPALLICLIFF